jgi:RNA polymerase sigma-70 factor (ECF subfamily)
MTGALPRLSAVTSCGPPMSALDPDRLVAHADLLYRAAWALCRSHHEAEDLVQETFARVLTRTRLLRRGNEVGYLLRALRNTYANHRRDAARRPVTVSMPDIDFGDASDISETITARDVMSAIAGAPAPYREAVVAVDVLGLSYEQAAGLLRTNKATITSRLARGRRRVAGILGE